MARGNRGWGAGGGGVTSGMRGRVWVKAAWSRG